MSPSLRALRRPSARVVVPAVVALGVAGVAVPVALGTTHSAITISGIAENGLVGKVGLSHLALRVEAKSRPASSLVLKLDGKRVRGAVDGSAVVLHPTGLSDGRHVLSAEASGGLSPFRSRTERTFTVDTTAPTLSVKEPQTAASLREPVTVTGTAAGAKQVTVDGRPLTLNGASFSVHFAVPPANVTLVATDAAGNSTTALLNVPVRHPMIRGVHMTGYGWNYTGLRDPVLALAKAHKINTVELDIKEEDGMVNYDTSVRLAHEAGAIRKLYNPKQVISELHAMNIRVVGRIVAFRDPMLAPWAWKHGHRDWVVQAPDGSPYNSAKYGAISFTNFAAKGVRDYNIALAKEAATLGFDDVMYDYVRRPDGPIHAMRFVGLTTTPEAEIADFVGDTRAVVRPLGAYLATAVFGVSATRPKEVAQNISMLAKYVDYVAPMVYPSHWAPGEYKVANPNAQPYDIVVRSLKDFQKKTENSDAQVFPWLQDFSLGVTYNTPQVVAEIKASADDHIHSFFLWNAGCRYHADALQVIPAS